MSESVNRFVTSEPGRARFNGRHPYLDQPADDPTTEAPAIEIGAKEDNSIECIFGLGQAKQDAFSALRANPWSSAEELAEFLDLDRSNVNRSLTYLLDRGLVTRRRRILQQGGYVYEYHVRSPVLIRDRLLNVFDDWSRLAKKQISEFVLGGSGGTEDDAWIEELLLAVTGSVTATEEYVFHHGVEVSRRAGEPIPDAIDRGEWSPELREQFVANGSWTAVTDALERLQAEGYLEPVDPATEDRWEGPYWRAVSSGKRT